ncbi:DUF222 domain-containing protein [Protaetiibacter sp. SSC-01]|uniref:HNH endonuclease signature motif containing protein n=1 Tax=Protaetiibacter sp. SSC-01 TaxID=2759943 RepID=UPI00165699BD|nr:HNH endonuclease signature motif containing protein [Protaetiibacter sp. SSC-01]QNO37955.1 DUF222 domain-containing protein [Protaetiibacter sp. SSC-01]
MATSASAFEASAAASYADAVRADADDARFVTTVIAPDGSVACPAATREFVDESDFAAWDRELGIPPVPEPVVEQASALGAIMIAACDADRLGEVTDRALLELAELVAAQERLVRAQSALIAGEVARRSRPELGLSGLAQSLGHRTAAELMRVATGSSLSDAKRSVAVGTMLVEAAEAARAAQAAGTAGGAGGGPGGEGGDGDAASVGTGRDGLGPSGDELTGDEPSGDEPSGDGPSGDVIGGVGLVDPATGEVLDAPVSAAAAPPVPPSQPWMAPVLQSVRSGDVSVEQADAIRRGLGEPDRPTGDPAQDAGRVTVEALTEAARLLADEARSLDVDRLRTRARVLRDELDVAGVALRERRRHEARSLRVYRQPDGMSRLVWLMDPETAAVVTEVYDRVTSPKLGGPRFVDAAQLERARGVERDPRSAEQLASDAFTELLRVGHTADPSLLLGEGAPAVRVLVTATDLAAGTGVAFLEGQTAPVSIATAERHICVAGARHIVFDAEKRPLDLGRTTRLYTRKQRIALHARDGGCMFPGCERPPSWTESHHIRHYVRDGGGSDIDDGISLCRHHHRLVHDQGWEFRHRVHEGAIRYELIPPRTIGRQQRPIPLPTKSGAYRRLAARH